MYRILKRFKRNHSFNISLIEKLIKNSYTPDAFIIRNLKNIPNADTHPRRSYICNAYISELDDMTYKPQYPEYDLD
ncbi:hypothetical protein AMJ74_04835 [candidate division WOR_3 bacterium SM1_77]|uniref:Uncharacterized protein n=1 Tax=candidate division WOR_3 bacterium SM1_77 TaxID=1703778 RepID=A0A0S8JYG5_UNCW3|nr:MAG: hypothetical protein AMJ74_04835 [candidate division WOR_3 bacterium SM1_77]